MAIIYLCFLVKYLLDNSDTKYIMSVSDRGNTNTRHTIMKLVFGKANAKLIALQNKMQEISNNKQKLATFSLLSGHTCPYAKECLSKAVENSEGKRSIQDGPDTQFRCFSASQEAQYTGVYNSRKNN